MLALLAHTWAQTFTCSTNQFPSSTITISSTGPTTITTCNYAGEYSVNNFTTTGVYTISVSGGSANYITFTDNSNNIIAQGNSPLTVTVTSTGLYRIHINTDNSCGTENTCRTTVVSPQPAGPCIQTYLFPSSTVTVNANNTTTISTCNYAGDYSVLNFTATGVYEISSTGGSGNYITFTDNSNAPIAYGSSPLTVTISSVGLYRVHFSVNSSCFTDNTCRTTLVMPTFTCSNTQYPTSTTTISSTAPTTITTCNYAGEYSVNNFTATGVYTISVNGGSANYITFTDNSNNIIAQGNSPLTVTVTSSGLYRIHINTDNACGTENTCRTTVVIPTLPPANDDCSNAISITVPGTYTGTTIGATTETVSLPTCSTTSVSQPGVWYTITTPSAMNIMASLCNTSPSWDSKIFIYEGNCGALNIIGCRDDNGPACSGTPASIAWCSQAGATYYILVTGYSSASNFTLDITDITSTNLLSVSVTPSPTVCAGTSVQLTATLTASGITSYSWNTGATTNTITDTPSNTTTYSISAVNNLFAGCTFTQSVLVTVNPTPTISINSSTICSGQSATLIANGATTYTWDSGATSNSIVVNPTITTTYTVTGEALGCSNTATTQVVVNPLPIVSSSVTNATTPGCSNGSATLTVSGNGPFIYSWSAPASSTTNVATNLNGTSGTGTNYTVIVTDANGCSSVSTFTVGCVTSISSINGGGILSVYPNPNNGSFIISFGSNVTKLVKIMDITGRVVKEISTSEKEIMVNMMNFARGTYIIEVMSEEGISRVSIIKE